MFTRPYSIYIDKRPMRIAFLVNPESTSLETIDQIIAYNRSLWGGRFNPIILTDGHTIDDKWWRFLRDIDPDVIKPLVHLDSKLIEKIENFLSPLEIEQFREDQQSTLRTRIDIRNPPASIDINSLNFPGLWTLHGGPTLGIFNLNEMDDEIGKCFVLRNFGTHKLTHAKHYVDRSFSVPRLPEETLNQGKIPLAIHEGFTKREMPFSSETYSKQSVQRPGSWAVMDKENAQIHYIDEESHRFVIRETQSFSDELNEIKKKVCFATNRESLATNLLAFARIPDIVFQDQICALPNTEREVDVNALINFFDVVIGDELQEITYFWNRPLAIRKFKRQFMNQMWLPKTLATDRNMEEALYAWFRRIAHLESNDRSILRFVSFSTAKRELEDIANSFRAQFHAHNLAVDTAAICFEEPQIPNFSPENPLFFQRESYFFERDNSIDIHRAQGNKDILELTEPNGLSRRGLVGHWMADFCIEFVHDKYENSDDVEMMTGRTLFWRLPNRNYLARYMFDRPSRIRRNGFLSARVKMGENVLRLTLANAELVVASLFCRDNPSAYANTPHTPLNVKPYASTETSDKGKYLRGVLELFGNLVFAREVFSNPYWRSIFDALSKNVNAEQHARESIANKLRKLMVQSDPLVDNPDAIKSLSKIVVNESKS